MRLREDLTKTPAGAEPFCGLHFSFQAFLQKFFFVHRVGPLRIPIFCGIPFMSFDCAIQGFNFSLSDV